MAFTGVPLMLPSRTASRAGLQPKVRPSGSSPTSSHVLTSPLPLMNGSKGGMVWFTKRSTCWVGYSSVNGRSKRGSRGSQTPSPSVSTGTLLSSTGLDVPHANSSTSDQVSSSSSKSSTRGGSEVESTPGTNSSGFSSLSVSFAPAGSSGKASGPAEHTSLTAFGPSQTPSPSVSALLDAVSSGRPSSSSLGMPSPSMSSSIKSQMPSPSKSSGPSSASSGSDAQSISSVSRKPSLSSSSSAVRPPGPSGSSSG